MAGLQKVLLVEDDLYIRDIYNVVLQKAGFKVEQAGEGNEALDKTIAFKPDVMLLDIMIPGIDGLEVLKRLRTDPQYQKVKPKVIIVTNLAQEETAEQAKKYGAEGYVVKADIEPSELVGMIKALEPTQSKNQQPEKPN